MKARPRFDLPIIIALLLAAFFLRTAGLADIPPGIHHDEVINRGIVDKILNGGVSIFYPDGQGREGFYFLFQAAAVALLGSGAFVMRLPSAFLGILGLCAAYALARRLLGRRVALLGLALMSITFWSIFPARMGLRAVSEPLIAALAAYALWRAVECNGRGALAFVLAGALLGLTIYTYRGARALPLAALALPAYLALFHRPALRRTWRGLAVCAAVTLLALLPLVMFLNAHPGIDQMTWAGRDRVLQSLQAGDPRPAINTTLATLGAFAVRGDPDDYYNLGGRPVFEPVTGILFMLGLCLAVWRVRQPRYAYLLMWLLLGLAPGMASEPAPHFYRILGAQAVAFAIPGIGLEWLAARITGMAITRRLPRLAALAVAILLVVDGAWNVRDYFFVWGRKDTVQVLWNTPLAQTARYLERSGQVEPVSLCTVLVNRREPWLRTGPDFFHALMRRTDAQTRFYDCRYSLVMPGGGAEALYAFPGATPVEEWISRYLAGWLQGTQPLESVELAHRANSANALLQAEVRGTLDKKLDELGPTVRGMPTDWDHALRLVGYELPGPPPRPGQSMALITWWRVENSIGAPDLQMFVHLLDGSGKIVAQQDLLSVMADTLQPGDVFAQVHEFIQIPEGAAPGEYQIEIGLYTTGQSRRLPIYDGNQLAGDHLVLSTVQVK